MTNELLSDIVSLRNHLQKIVDKYFSSSEALEFVEYDGEVFVWVNTGLLKNLD